MAAALASKGIRRGLYPALEPYASGLIDVSGGHRMYYEECGSRDGQPAVVLHGGPGGGIVPYYRQFFDPVAYRVILFDQRGAGRSTPRAALHENTTWDLVGDMERLREHLGIERWLLFGGSWGSTLALSYAITHTSRVTALILRGIFTLRRHELIWFYQQGASYLFPDAFAKFQAVIPAVERHDMISAYHRRLTSDDEPTQLEAARAWSIYEMETSRLHVDAGYVARAQDDDQFCLQFARIESHYFVHGGFFESDDWILDHAAASLQDIPGVIVQGRYDVVCPAKTAWELHRCWPRSSLEMIPDAGHSAKEPGIIDALVRATDEFRL